MAKEGEGLMDGRKLAIYIMLVSAMAGVLSQTPMIQAIGRGQHTFESGRMVDCVKCHQNDAYQDMLNSQDVVLDAHKRAAGNKNYTTYLEVGGISYNQAGGIINTNVDSDNSGTNDTWTWNGAMWVYNNTGRLYDLDLDGNGTIEGAEMCKLCHNLELMGVSTAVSEVHTVGTRYCDDDRCHGNKNYTYNAYTLFANSRNNVTSAGKIISNNSIHGGFYNEGAGRDANNSMLHPYGIMPGNVAPNNVNNISVSPYTCVGCHTAVNVSGSVAPSPLYNHSDANYPKQRYT